MLVWVNVYGWVDVHYCPIIVNRYMDSSTCDRSTGILKDPRQLISSEYFPCVVLYMIWIGVAQFPGGWVFEIAACNPGFLYSVMCGLGVFPLHQVVAFPLVGVSWRRPQGSGQDVFVPMTFGWRALCNCRVRYVSFGKVLLVT